MTPLPHIPALRRGRLYESLDHRFYPTDHDGAAEILKSCGRALIFGVNNTTAQYSGDPGIQIHGPGYSKILIGDDQVRRWPEFIDVMVASISDNGRADIPVCWCTELSSSVQNANPRSGTAHESVRSVHPVR
jgi:hypothetical protein